MAPNAKQASSEGRQVALANAPLGTVTVREFGRDGRDRWLRQRARVSFWCLFLKRQYAHANRLQKSRDRQIHFGRRKETMRTDLVKSHSGKIPVHVGCQDEESKNRPSFRLSLSTREISIFAVRFV